MSTTPTATALLVWLTPSMFALFLYGIGQGLIKQYIGEVSPARFCLYFVLAKAMVNLSWFFTHDHAPLLSTDGRSFLELGILAYVIDGTGWILYFESIIAGPITIVGTLSAAYPALTVLFARIFLGEQLGAVQYAAVALVIGGCLGLSYSPPDPAAKILNRRWIPLAFLALACWATSNTIVKHAYSFAEASEINLMVCTRCDDREPLRADFDRDSFDGCLSGSDARVRGADPQRANLDAPVRLHRRDHYRYGVLHLIKRRFNHE
jgi:uncharacterized membrane protein